MHQNLLIVEATADPFDWVDEGQPHPWTFTLVQAEMERPERFAARVQRWITGVRRQRGALDRVILLCGDCWDPDVLRARLSLLIAARVDGQADQVILQVDGTSIESVSPSDDGSTRRTTSSSRPRTSWQA